MGYCKHELDTINMFDSPLKIVIPPPPPYLTPHNGHTSPQRPLLLSGGRCLERFYYVIKINTKINLVFHNLYTL